jgi:FkbM family methyltransferase
MSDRIAINVGEHLVLTTTIHGRKIYVDERDTTVAPHLIADGFWESWISGFFERMLAARHDEPGAAVLDVGANFGWYALLAHWLPSPGHYDVWGFEPNPQAFRCLQRTWSVNGMNLAHLRHVALGDHIGKHRLHYYLHELANATLLADGGMLRVIPEGEPLEHEILVEPLDGLFSGSRVAAIKIDAEGFEPQILRGAQRVLADNPAIDLLIEHHQDGQHDEMVARLQEQRFGVFLIDVDGQAHLRTREQLRQERGGQMLYARRMHVR